MNLHLIVSFVFSWMSKHASFFFIANSTGSPVQLPYSEARQRQGSQYVVCQWATDPQNKRRNRGQELQCKYSSIYNMYNEQYMKYTVYSNNTQLQSIFYRVPMHHYKSMNCTNWHIKRKIIKPCNCITSEKH